MRSRRFHHTSEEREAYLGVLQEALAAHMEVVFAYVHGSFLEDRPYRDIDVGVYLDTEVDVDAAEETASLAMALEESLEKSPATALEARTARPAGEPGCRRIPVDVRILNSAPLGFCYHVLRGRLLFSRNEDLRVQWTVRTVSRYLDLKPLRTRALKEAMIAWSQTKKD